MATPEHKTPVDGEKPGKIRYLRSHRNPASPPEGASSLKALQSQTLAWLAAMLFCAGIFFAFGLAAGLYRSHTAARSESPAAKGFVAADEQEEKLLNRVFALLREGYGQGALGSLQKLRSINPQLSSLSYTAALAALQAGDIATAMAETDSSLGKGERISDSYALAAAAESLKPGSVEWRSKGDPRERGDFFLRQAIAADQANAVPRLELGIRFRSRGQNDEAVEMLESARLRLHPLDQAAVIDTTLLLIKLGQTATEALPADFDPDKNTPSLLGAAYVALRRGDFAAASELLAKAKSRIAPELYLYLLGDPAFAAYRQNPEFAPLLR